MKNSIISMLLLAAAVACWIPTASGQTATPTTTLCGAQTQSATMLCLQSTTGVVDQTSIYVDQEFETVILTASQTVCTGPCSVKVSRNSRAAGSGPTAHANGAIAWVALIPSASVVPGSNGFAQGTNVTEIGPCTRGNHAYLPHIWVDRGIKRDCTATGVWVDYAPLSGLDYPSPTPLTAITVAGPTALSVTSGNYVLNTLAGVIALTLAAPTAGVQDGMVITITANNGAHADTLTATGLLQTGGSGSPYTTATFGVTTAFNGASLTLKSYGGYWFVIASVNVAFT